MTDRPAGGWEGEAAGDLARRWGVPAVHLFAEVGSTNDVARRLAAAGAADGTVVLAERQLAGRGRSGRAWASPAGLGLWLTLVHRPADARAVALLPVRVGLSLAAALDPLLAPASVLLKWPNDLLVGERKIGGILCEAAWAGDRAGAVAVGVGLNLRHAADDFAPELRDLATSAAIAAGRPVSRLAAADAVVPALLAAARGSGLLSPRESEVYAARDALAGRAVAVTDPADGAPLAEGMALGLSPEGALLVRSTGGALRTVRSGTVRPIPLSTA